MAPETGSNTWRTRVIHTYDVQCKSLCPLLCYVRDGELMRVEPDRRHPAGGSICPKGLAIKEILGNSQRLRRPLRRTRQKGDPDPGWEEISWDAALDLAAERLLDLRERYGAESVAFYRGARGGTPSVDYEPLVIRLASAFGSPNTISTGHICNWHRDTGTRYTLGGGLPEPDYEHSAAILIWGFNPDRNWLNHRLGIRTALRAGAKLLVVDPRRTELARRADLWLQVKPGGDIYLALALLNVFLSGGFSDREFVSQWTNAPFLVRDDNGRFLHPAEIGLSGGNYVAWDGSPVAYDARRRSFTRPVVQPALEGEYVFVTETGASITCRPAWELLRRAVAPYTPEAVSGETWVDPAKVREAARFLGTTRPLSYFTYNGVEQSLNALQTNRALTILYALTGHLETRGGNVTYPTPAVNKLDGRELLPPAQRKKTLGLAERPLGPPSTGKVQAYQFYRAVLTGEPYPVRGLVSFGGNLMMANGDSRIGAKALAALDFYLHADIYLSPSAAFADLVLPASTPWEGWYVRAGFGRGGAASNHVQLRPRVVDPLPDSRPDQEIILDLALRLGLGEHFWDGDLERGFNYYLAPTGLTVDDLRRHPGGITLSREVRYRRFAELEGGIPRGFATPSGRVEIYCSQFLDYGYPPLPQPARLPEALRPDADFPLLLTTAKLREFCHGQHRAVPALRSRHPEPTLEVHPDTARRLGLVEGRWVRLATRWGAIRLRLQVSDRVDRRVVCTQHGWWQACEALGLPGYDPLSEDGANVNLLLVNDYRDAITGSVHMRGIPCRVTPLETG